MLDKDIQIRFTLRQVFGRTWVPPLVSVTIFLFFWSATYWRWDRIDWPAWVQAVGSVIAILVAAWAALHASNSQMRAVQRAEDLRASIAVRALYEVAVRGNASTTLMLRWVDDEKPIEESPADFVTKQIELELARVQEIKLTEMPSADMIENLLNLIFCLKHSADLVRTINENGKSARARASLANLDGMLEELIEALCA